MSPGLVRGRQVEALPFSRHRQCASPHERRFFPIYHWVDSSGCVLRVAEADGADDEGEWYEEKTSQFPADAALLCGFARFQVLFKDLG